MNITERVRALLDTAQRFWPIAAGMVAFGLLMGLRYEMSSVIARAAVAGCAFASLGWGLSRVR